MHDCRQVSELVSDYVDGHMPVGERLLFRLHLLACPPCRRYVDQLRASRLAARGAARRDVLELPDDVRDAMLEAFRGWKDSSSTGSPP
jgi:anti-sigma factor RsiW